MPTRSDRLPAAVVFVVLVATAGCSQGGALLGAGGQAEAAAFATVASGTDAGSVQSTGTGCAEDDIECHERRYQLEETLHMYEARVGGQWDAPARGCWLADAAAFRDSLEACPDDGCRTTALLERIASLQFLQPEHERASLALPKAPALIAVLAPSPDAAPEERPALPTAPEFEASGPLIHASSHPKHMGIAVDAGAVQAHVFLWDMDIGGSPAQDEVLGLVGASPTARVLVRGHRRTAPDGVPNFDASHCRFVYQLP